MQMSEDSVDREIARFDKDIANGIYDENLVLQSKLDELRKKDDEEESDQDVQKRGSKLKQVADEEEEKDEEIKTESNISRALSEQITKVVVILVLLMLFLLPVVSPDTYVEEQWSHQNQLNMISSIYNAKTSW